MDKKTLREITRRVNAYKQKNANSELNREMLETHIDALVEVFNVSREEVEQIANNVIQTKPISKRLISPKALKYFAFCTALLIMLTALFILSNRVKLLEQQGGIVALEYTEVTPENLSNAQTTSTPIYNYLIQKAMMGEILALITPVKMYLVEYYQMNDAFPDSLEAMGLSREEMKTGRYIDDLSIGPNGQIRVQASQQLGQNIFITLAPKITMGGMNIEWTCLTNHPHPPSTCQLSSAKPIQE